ncbi:MAG: hypothetical protein ACO3VO_00125 [Ilumatobacteraceae bacterium]
MPTENPYPPPAPLVLADMLAMHAWSDHIDDHSRKLLEWAADTIRLVVRRNAQLSHDRDNAEADAAHLFALHYGPQKGGAA